ncbi:MAG TPA: hypothetical protein VFF86_07070, partial [Candidatus Methylomirabilis sp.]|nr:hypothetical protein [Candidatus Methylomirabilis sp.]
MGGKIWQTLTLIALMTLETSCGREDQPKGDPATQDRGPVAQVKGMAGMEMSGGGIMVDPAKQQLIGMR